MRRRFMKKRYGRKRFGKKRRGGFKKRATRGLRIGYRW